MIWSQQGPAGAIYDDGRFTVGAANGDTITGTYTDSEGGIDESGALWFRDKWTITGGTGRSAGATGHGEEGGSATAGFYAMLAGAPVAMWLEGTIAYKRRESPLKRGDRDHDTGLLVEDRRSKRWPARDDYRLLARRENRVLDEGPRIGQCRIRVGHTVTFAVALDSCTPAPSLRAANSKKTPVSHAPGEREAGHHGQDAGAEHVRGYGTRHRSEQEFGDVRRCCVRLPACRR